MLNICIYDKDLNTKKAVLHDSLCKKNCKLLKYERVLKSIRTILKRKSILLSVFVDEKDAKS